LSFPKGTLKLTSEKKQKLWTQERVLREYKLDDGKSLSFDNYDYWKQIYENISPMMVFQCSRQVGKTTFILGQMMIRALEKDHRKISLLVPRKKHADTIVGLMDRRIQLSPYIRPLIGTRGRAGDKKKKDTSEIKQFKNGSQFDITILENSPDGVQGKTAEFLFFDETQLIPEEHIPVALELAQTFQNPQIVYAGNPRSPVNYLHKLFQGGSQFEWIVPCPSCKKNQYPLGEANLDLNVEAVICRDCRNPLDVTRGHWEAQNSHASYPSYRISALMSPTNRFRTPGETGILDKMETYPRDKFITNVLGLPTELGDAVITESDLRLCCEENIEFISGLEEAPIFLQGRRLIIAIDWVFNDKNLGSSTTMATLWVINHAERLQCVWAKRFVGPQYHDPESVLKEILSVAKQYRVNLICTDYGMGHKENIRLRKYLKGTETQVFEIQYAGALPYLNYNAGESLFRINRTRSLSITLDAVKEKKFMFPPWELSQPFLKDLLNVYQERTENDNLKYLHSGPDDFLHCMNYALHGFIKLPNVFFP